MKIFICTSAIMVFCVMMPVIPTNAQTAPAEDYQQYLAKDDCDNALKIIRKKLRDSYDLRTEDKRIPANFITSRKLAESINLNELFRKRKLEGFFIEDNKELYTLHHEAGRCLLKKEEYDDALNNLYQCLRFGPLENGKSDIVFYEIAQAYNKQHQTAAYLRSLEAAYTLNPTKLEYSLELGKALYSTNEKKKAIFHLERYLRSTGDQLKEPDLLLMAGNLNEDLGRYLETVRLYKEYLQLKPENGYIHFALGYLAYKNTGDYPLALSSFESSIKLLPANEILRKSKAYEFTGDIYAKELEPEKAIAAYLETIKFQDQVRAQLEKKSQDIIASKKQIVEIKSSLMKNEDFNKYNEYEYLMDEKGKLELEKRNTSYSYSKLNPGGVRWNIAECYEKAGKLTDAISYYRQCVDFDYNANKARERILKLQLKISRGY